MAAATQRAACPFSARKSGEQARVRPASGADPVCRRRVSALTSPPCVTDFQARVYEVLRTIPRGCVMTYAEVARRVGCGSARAVGQALRHNPFSPEVPCHRVIASDLSAGGYAGRREGPELARKLALLEQEGVRFSEGRLADPARVCHAILRTARRRTPRTGA